MMATSFTAVGTASAVLALSKAAWKLGSSLSKLSQDTTPVHNTIKDLAEDVKSLGNECDFVYAELEEVLSKHGTGSLQPYDIDGKLWNCLATQVEETGRTIQELEQLIRSIKGDKPNITIEAQRQRKLDESADYISSLRLRVCRQADHLRASLVLIKTVLWHIAPSRTDQELAKELRILQNMAEKLQISSQAFPRAQGSHAQDALIQCVHEVIVTGRSMYEASLTTESVPRGQEAAGRNVGHVDWVAILHCIRQDQQRPDPLGIDLDASFVLSRNEAQNAGQEHLPVDAIWEGDNDDLDTDLTKAALDTGAKAFEAREWLEADSLLQEALRGLQQLSKQQRVFCDTFDLHYKLAVCAYHTQEPADAERALVSLAQEPAGSDEQQGYIYDAMHMLSFLYIRMGQIDRARSECEKVLQGRYRLLGKQSDASLESLALMAHIYLLLNHRAGAITRLAIIPETRREAILQIVEDSLGTKMERFDSSLLRTRTVFEDSGPAIHRIHSRPSASSLQQSTGDRCYGPVSPTIPKSPIARSGQSHHRISSNKASWDDKRSVTTTSLSSAQSRRESRATEDDTVAKTYSTEKEKAQDVYSTDPEVVSVITQGTGKALSRKEILTRIGCPPKDRIEDAVCDGDRAALTNLLNKEKGFWRTKLRKRVRPERLTALHYAALFGEIGMARELLAANYNINEVPYGYSTILTPLTLAIGARQVNMVEFLIKNGARPTEPDTWSTLAGHLMNRSWLTKTMSDAEKAFVPGRIIAICKILLQNGWDVNKPIEPSGRTVLHQAVAFGTGSYVWDLTLRTAMVPFLCEHGADPFQPNVDDKTPYDLALAAGHEDLLLIFSRASKLGKSHHVLREPAELSGDVGTAV